MCVFISAPSVKPSSSESESFGSVLCVFISAPSVKPSSSESGSYGSVVGGIGAMLYLEGKSS